MKKKLTNKVFVIITVLFGLSIIVGYGMHNYFLKTAINNKDNNVAEKELIPENTTYNFLILGVDERDADVGRSDTMMVLSVNLATKRIGLISIPRDSMVTIPEHGDTKINHAFAYGGVNLTRQVIEKTLNIKIDNYVLFNFKSFKNTIDVMGGIDINVEKDMYYRDDYDGENGLIIDLKKGNQHLDGEKAIEYVRYRDEEGDIGRVRRQQSFLNAIISKLTTPETIIKLPSLVREIFTSIKTNITFDDLVSYIAYIKPNQIYQTQSVLLSGTPEMIDDISYWILNKEDVLKQLKEINDFIVDKKEDDSLKKDSNTGIFKEKEDKTELDWEIDKLTEENKIKMKNIKDKLLKEEALERAETLAKTTNDFIVKDQQVNTNGITIINTTSDFDKSSFAVDALVEKGMPIGIINNKKTGKSNEKTVFIVSTKDENLNSILKLLPFNFSIIYKANTEKSTLIIGNDFYK